jgi:hypothetical protein
VVGWEYQEPFASLMRKHQAPEPILVSAHDKRDHEAKRRPGARYERRSPGQLARAYLRTGLKQFNLAELVGRLSNPVPDLRDLLVDVNRIGE